MTKGIGLGLFIHHRMETVTNVYLGGSQRLPGAMACFHALLNDVVTIL